MAVTNYYEWAWCGGAGLLDCVVICAWLCELRGLEEVDKFCCWGCGGPPAGARSLYPAFGVCEL